MAIKRIKVKNFKSFKELDVELGNLNILIGANASGKSNFVDIFRFLRDIEDSGLKNAISLQDGVEYLRNANIGLSEPFSLEIVYDQISVPGFRVLIPAELEGRPVSIVEVCEAIYKLSIESVEAAPGFKVVEHKIEYKGKLAVIEGDKTKELEEYGLAKVVYSNDGGRLTWELPDSIQGLPKQIDLGPYPGYIYPEYIVDRFLLSSARLERISIYDFDPRFARGYAPTKGKVELEENGNNLAIAIKNIIESEDGKRKLMNLVTYLLDFVDDLDVERRTIDRSHLLKIKETYFDKPLPVSLISDGTVNMLALIVALYFEKKPLTIIEEPAKGVHPYLISRVAHMLEDASRNKQIIVTTHNPEMVRHAELENILLVSRDEFGFSSIYRPSEKEDVRIFLKNGLRVEDLYVDSLLETL